MQETNISVKWLIYAFLIGLSANACFSILTISQTSFSPFPFLTLFFAISHFYGLYLNEANNEATIRPAWAAFFVGIFSYSAFIGALYPERGSNFLSLTITLILVIWLMYKLMFGDKHYSA
ncbi:YijD family membrane protein [Psychromonas aquatilis]|uniref:YijD family membrane protein n=1 Tax=Psychromonas aquatilis TaxID=2005072 RepID=A0ABU9GM38_9GAMM